MVFCSVDPAILPVLRKACFRVSPQLSRAHREVSSERLRGFDSCLSHRAIEYVEVRLKTKDIGIWFKCYLLSNQLLHIGLATDPLHPQSSYMSVFSGYHCLSTHN